MLAEEENVGKLCIEIEIEEEDVIPIIDKNFSFFIEKYSSYFSRYQKLCSYRYFVDTKNMIAYTIEDIKYLIEDICEAMDKQDEEKKDKLYNLLLDSTEKLIKSLKRYGIDLFKDVLQSK